MTNVNVRAGQEAYILKPDVMVSCNPEFYQKREDTILNPRMVFEVLSESTSSYDKTEKLRLYRSVPSIQEYILVSQWEPTIWRYERTDGPFWKDEPVFGLDSFLELKSIGVTISMRSLYRSVDFPES